MFSGTETQNLYEQCLQRGFCQEHSSEFTKTNCDEESSEFIRKAALFIRINVLDPVYFKKSQKCETIKSLLQKTRYFSQCMDRSIIPVEAYDSILILDSVAIFTVCHLSKICCIGALFEYKHGFLSNDPEIKFLYNLLHTDRFQESDINHINPLLKKNFIGCDSNLLTICYAFTLLFVRKVCLKLSIHSAVQELEKDIMENSGDYKVFIERQFTDKRCIKPQLLATRALMRNKMEKFKEAQMDSYIAVMLDPYLCKGYCELTFALLHLSLFKEAFQVANYGLSLCHEGDEGYKALENIKIESEKKFLNFKKNDMCNSKLKMPVNEVNNEENNNFPDLIEASDSEESDYEKPPELVDGSDSDENETTKRKQREMSSPSKNKKLGPSKRKRHTSQGIPDIKVEEEVLDNTKINSYLKEASEAILEDCGFKAVQIFRGNLRSFIESLDSFTNFEECEIVCIKCMYGLAYCKAGEYDDLQKSILIFKEIIDKHKMINFPAVYYALGLAYRKLNRFRDALSYLEKVKNILSKGIHFNVYCWPGTSTVIKETKAEILKDKVDELFYECENPPNPDAICRFVECDFQPAIYYTDPGFKGYISLSCSDQCCLQYHVSCWKILKNQRELTDKEFLEEPCLTPDCDGIIIKVHTIDKKGDVTKEFISNAKKMTKNRWARWEKKTDVKEKKKKKTANIKTDDGNQDNSIEDRASSRKSSLTRRESESSVECLITNNTPVEEKTSTNQNDAEINEATSDIPNSSEGVKYEVKCCSPVQAHHETFNISDVKESTINDLKNECEVTKGIFSGAIKENSFFSSVQAQFKELNAPITTESKTNDTGSRNAMDLVCRSIKRNIYSYMAEFLHLHGPLRIDDPKLVNEISTFPEETLKMINKCGGIGEFLKNDLSFAYVGDAYVCVISDVSVAYQMHTNSSLPSEIKNLKSLENSNNFKYNYCERTLARAHTLNPDAAAYTPSGSSDLSNKDANYKYLIGNTPSGSSDLSNKDANYKYLIGTPLYKNNDEKPYVNTVFMLPQSGNKPSVSQNPNELFLSKDFPNKSKHEKSAFCSAPYDSSKLSFSTPSLNTKTVESNSASNKSLSCSLGNKKKLLECQVKSELTSAAINPDKVSNKMYMSVSKGKEGSHNFGFGDDATEIKEFGETLLELIELYYSNKMLKHQQQIDSFIKPYVIKRKAETNTSETLTDRKEEVFEDIINQSNALKAENEHLLEQKLLLENQLSSAKEREEDLSAQVENVKKNLEVALIELKTVKDKLTTKEAKEEEMQDGRKYLYDSLTNAYETIDKQKKDVDLLKSEKLSLQLQMDDLKLSIQEAEKHVKAQFESQIKEYAVEVQTLEKENNQLKSRAKHADLGVLNLKKTEFLKKVDEKASEASKRRKEVTDGLSFVSGSLNPLFQASMKTLSAQLSSYINDLTAIKLNFMVKIDKQIDEIKSGSSLNDLEQIEIIELPEMPSIEKTLATNSPAIDKTLMNSNQSSLSSFAAARASNSTSSVLPSSLIVPPVAAVPPVFPTSSFFTSSVPLSTNVALPLSAAPLSTSTSLPISSETKKSETPTNSDSVTLLDLKHLVQKSLTGSASSLHSPSSTPLPSPEYTLDDSVPHKIPKSVDHMSSLNDGKIDSSKVPDISKSTVHEFSKAPGTNVIDKKICSKPDSSLYSFNGGLDAIPKVSEQEKKKACATASKNSYEKLLSKLKERYPGYTQEKLMSFIKEFRMQRQGTLSGLPMDNIISEISTMINSKKAVDKKVPTKGLVNKKLIPDLKPKDPVPEPPTVKKKCAWNVVDKTTEKTWSGSFDDDCIICHEDMSSVTAYKVPCGHTFHEKCIRQWLQHKSDCPVCRVLLLLPEDYPSLT